MTTTDERGSDLKPCPFCGSRPVTTVSCAPETEGLISVGCAQDATICSVSPHVFASTRSGAIAAWNRRSVEGGVPEGMVLVPREPTEAWALRVDLERNGVGHHQSGCTCGECCITAVLAASPQSNDGSAK